MVSSLDGFIAKKDGTVSWLESSDSYDQGKTLTESDIASYLESIDCYVMGSHTYEHAIKLGWPYGDLPVIVLTHRDLPNYRSTVEFYSGDLIQLLDNQLKPKFNNIWFVGGAKVAKEALRLGLIDEIIISKMPIILGDGILFFDFIGTELKLHLKDVVAYKDGMVELTYDVIK